MYKAGPRATAFSVAPIGPGSRSTRRRNTFARTARSAGAAPRPSAVFRQCSTQRTSSRTAAACADLVEDLRPVAADPLGERLEDRAAADGTDRRRRAGDEVVARAGHHGPLRADLHQASLPALDAVAAERIDGRRHGRRARVKHQMGPAFHRQPRSGRAIAGRRRTTAAAQSSRARPRRRREGSGDGPNGRHSWPRTGRPGPSGCRGRRLRSAGSGLCIVGGARRPRRRPMLRPPPECRRRPFRNRARKTPGPAADETRRQCVWGGCRATSVQSLS